MSVLVEVCVESPSSAAAAEAGGAGRVELCVEIGVDGLTPPPEDVAETCRLLHIPVHVLIRPRPGGFVADDAGFAVMRRDLIAVKPLGAAGVVLGLNTPDGHVDRDRVAALVALRAKLTDHGSEATRA